MGVIKVSDSRASVGNAIRYITKKEKTEVRLISGYNCNPKTAILEMQDTKNAWRKTGGRQCKHIIQSFSKDEAITPQEAHSIAAELVQTCPLLQGFEICYATHKDREHVHTHYIINSVSFETGKKFHQSKRDLQALKDFSDGILLAHGKSICEKNREITAFKIDTYRTIEKAAQGTYKSWMYDILAAIYETMQSACGKTDFITKLKERGITVNWHDERKYIVFEDESVNKVRNKTLSKTFKINLYKEALLYEFRQNDGRTPTAEKRDTKQGAGRSGRAGQFVTAGSVDELRQRYIEISGAGGADDRRESGGSAKSAGRDKLPGVRAANEQRPAESRNGRETARIRRRDDRER